MAPATNMVGASSWKIVTVSESTLAARRGIRCRSRVGRFGQPMPSNLGELSHVEERSRKTHLGEPPDAAQIRAVAADIVGRQRYLNRNGRGTRTWFLRCKQTIFSTIRRAADLPHTTPPPFVAADQADGGNVTHLDLLEIALRKVDGDETVFAIGEI